MLSSVSDPSRSPIIIIPIVCSLIYSIISNLSSNLLYKFASNKGQMTIICSPNIKEEDEKAILEGYKKRSEVLEMSVLEELDKLMRDPENIKAAKFVATLIANNILDIKIAENKDLKGIMRSHIHLPLVMYIKFC